MFCHHDPAPVVKDWSTRNFHWLGDPMKRYPSDTRFHICCSDPDGTRACGYVPDASAPLCSPVRSKHPASKEAVGSAMGSTSARVQVSKQQEASPEQKALNQSSDGRHPAQTGIAAAR